ncbi:MAG: MFS transporter [Gammaproteobacteria bacterium]|nr:MFS transporter [Gammaproteobacteria bacterium]
MIPIVIQIFAPLLSLIVFTLGSGLLTTLLTVRLHMAGSGTWMIGILTAVYYFGLVVGSFFSGNFIRRVGHIRIYATFASILAVATILQGIFLNDTVWLILRFISGYCIAGLYIAIESWLLVIAEPKMRGTILSLYMISFYAALGGGQFLLNVSDINTIVPFCIVGMLCSLSIVPISMTRATCPSVEDTNGLSFRQLYKISPSGVIGCFAAGLISSVIYGLMPLFIKQLNLPDTFVALTMGLTIFGAMFLQYPLGRISDFFERRKVLIVVSFVSLAIAVLLMLTAYHLPTLFLVFAFIFGGASFALYPLSITHTCDYLSRKDIIIATQGLLLANGIGSIIGPILVPGFIDVMGPLGLFVYFGFVCGLLGLFFSWRRTKTSKTPIEEQGEFVTMPRTSPVVTGLDPRAEE